MESLAVVQSSHPSSMNLLIQLEWQKGSKVRSSFPSFFYFSLHQFRDVSQAWKVLCYRNRPLLLEKLYNLPLLQLILKLSLVIPPGPPCSPKPTAVFPLHDQFSPPSSTQSLTGVLASITASSTYLHHKNPSISVPQQLLLSSHQ